MTGRIFKARTAAAVGAALGLLCAGVAMAQNTAPIEARKKLYKDIGAQTKAIGEYLRGEKPFDAAVVKAAFGKIADDAKQLPALFPDDSKTGLDTEALPKIWAEKAKFEGLLGNLQADASAAASGIADEASLKALGGKVFGNCKTCHDEFRAKK